MVKPMELLDTHNNHNTNKQKRVGTKTLLDSCNKHYMTKNKQTHVGVNKVICWTHIINTPHNRRKNQGSYWIHIVNTTN